MTWRSIKQIAPALGADTQGKSKSGKWTKEQIRRARRAPLAPLLRERGYHLREKPHGNYLVEDQGDLVVKESYWIWESREMKGNAIDFFMLVECRSFNEAMETLMEKD